MTGGLFLFPTRFLDEGVGYAAGWFTWFSWSVIIASEVLAVAQLWNFEFDAEYLKANQYPDTTLRWGIGQDYDAAVWVSIFLVVILVVNLLKVRWYGWVEYILACVKLTFIVGLIVFNTIINAMQTIPRASKSRFWTYNQPYSFTSQNITLHPKPDGTAQIHDGTSGVFLAMWTAMTTIVFSVIGFEAVSVTAGENKDLQRAESIKISTKKIALRVILLYTLGTFTVGLNVPYTDENLADFAPSCERAWMNLKIVQAFRQQLQRTKFGVPYYAVFCSWLVGLLAFLATQQFPAVVSAISSYVVTELTSEEELGRLATNSVVSMLLVYTVLCASFMSFQKTIAKASEGKLPGEIDFGTEALYDRFKSTYPFRSRWQLPGPRAVYGLTSCALLAIFNGWTAFVKPFSTPDFIASYIGFAIFLFLIAWYHVMLDRTLNPLAWRRHASRELRQPIPEQVLPAERRGYLRKADPHKSWLVTENLWAVMRCGWVWLK
ncbi:MAG: hypothetical protein Q9162_001863 [Coniocarpon cinnabarinum]